MSTKITDGKLVVRVIEEVDLNGRTYGNTNKHEITGINEVSERILTIPTTSITILSASAAVGAGTFVAGNIQYFRITNLDDTNFVRLTFASGTQGTSSGQAANTSDLKLEANRTMTFANPAFSGSATNASFDAFSNFTNLKGVADSAAVDIELFVASK